MSDTPEVLFVRVHHAGRSQMAALLDHHARGRVQVRSAGSAPADEINPAVRAAMDEIGIDLSTAFPEKLTTDAVEAADVVITTGCGDACPVLPGRRYPDWQLPDPAGEDLDAVRPIRDDIDHRVEALLRELVPAHPRTRTPDRSGVRGGGTASRAAPLPGRHQEQHDQERQPYPPPRSTTAGSRASIVGNRDRVDLDEVPGIGQRLYADQRVGGLVVAEQRCPGLLDHR